MAKTQQKNIVLNIEPPTTSKPRKTKASVQSMKPPKATKSIVEPIVATGHNSKQTVLITLMRRVEGATLEDLTAATGWQSHSIRGLISGVIKKRLGFIVTAGKEERGRVYRITGERR